MCSRNILLLNAFFSWMHKTPTKKHNFDISTEPTNYLHRTIGAECTWVYLTGLYQKGFNGRIIFPTHHGCKGPCDTWIHTSILKQLCYLVLGGSRNTMEWAQLGQGLQKVSVLSIQRAYFDSCHCKVLEMTQCNACKRTVKTKPHWRRNDISLYCQQGYTKASQSHRVQDSTYLAHSPHYMCPLWVRQTEIRPHH